MTADPMLASRAGGPARRRVVRSLAVAMMDFVTQAELDELRESVLRWFAANHRKMPVRETRDPYAVWVSEIMLQQTTVAAVMPYWERFMARFPTIQALADATLHDVLARRGRDWGSYSRARNLHKAARVIVERYGGAFPTELSHVMALPGVGRYTAGAILSLAFGQDIPVVDANVTRVLCRWFLVEGDPRSSAVQKVLWERAEHILPRGRARAWNLALFDIGATVCLPRNPQCLVCPAYASCEARKTGRQEELPQHAPREPLTVQTDVAAFVRDGDGGILLVQRPDTGVWASMWELPRGTLEPGETAETGLQRIARDLLGITLSGIEETAVIKHGVMRRSITLKAYRANLATGKGPEGPAHWLWVAPDELSTLAMSSPQRKLLARILNGG